MKNIYSIVEDLLRAETSSLVELAEIAGLDPKVMYAGADFRGLKLSKQDSELVRSCGGQVDPEAGIPERELDEVGGTEEPAIRRISDIRLQLFLGFFRSYSSIGLSHPLVEYISDLLGPERSVSELRNVEAVFVQLVLHKATQYWPEFPNIEAQVKFVSVICKARFVFGLKELSLIAKSLPIVLYGDRFLRTFNLNLCSSEFIMRVIEANSDRRNRNTAAFVSAIVRDLECISADLALFLIKREVSVGQVAQILSKLGGVDLIEARKEVSEACIKRVNTYVDIKLMIDSLSKQPLIQRHLIFLGIRSRKVDVSIASIRVAFEHGIEVRNIEFGEILYGFQSFEMRLDFALRTRKFFSASSMRILVDELLKYALSSEQREIVRRTFADFLPNW